MDLTLGEHRFIEDIDNEKAAVRPGILPTNNAAHGNSVKEEMEAT